MITTTPKAFIKLDNTNHVVGYRAGILDNTNLEQNEVELPFVGFDFQNYIFKLYNATTNQFTTDNITQERIAQQAAAEARIPPTQPNQGA
jgi:hypothetical protein